ncbi:MAG: hypothetical protein V4739_18300 [Pseudomonadota bacterium]
MSTMFESTIPPGEPELMRASKYVRYLKGETTQPNAPGLSTHGDLSPSLRDDLSRFDQHEGGAEMLEVMAACVRHSERLTMQLHCGQHVVPLTVFPQERLAYSPLPMEELLSMPMHEMRVIHIEPAALHPPHSGDDNPIGQPQLYHPLAPLLWALALRGARDALLPEIAGSAAYRIAPAIDLTPMLNSDLLVNAVERLRRETTNLRSLAEWPGLDTERASRLLNAIYLQSALIVTRSHPDAVSDSWFGALSQR